MRVTPSTNNTCTGRHSPSTARRNTSTDASEPSARRGETVSDVPWWQPFEVWNLPSFPSVQVITPIHGNEVRADRDDDDGGIDPSERGADCDEDDAIALAKQRAGKS